MSAAGSHALLLRTAATLLAVLLAPAWAAHAQSAGVSVPPDRTALERLALVRARGDLLAAVQQLRLTDELSVGDWAAASVALDRDLRRYVRSLPSTGPPRVYSDGALELDLRLTRNELWGQLAALWREHQAVAARRLSQSDLDSAAQRWPTLWATGSASKSEQAPADSPLGWEDVQAEGRRLAEQAAAADAAHALLDLAGRLKVTAARRLSEFLDSDAGVHDAVAEAVQAAASMRVDFAPDQVAVAEARIGLADLIRILMDVHARLYRGDLFHAADFRGLTLSTPQAELTAAGFATAPARYRLASPVARLEAGAPAWASAGLAALGSFVPGEAGDLPLELRVELARLDGLEGLRRQIERLVVRRDVTVGQLLEHRSELKPDLATFLTGARAVHELESTADATGELRMELPLRRLWLILRGTVKEIEPDR